MRRAIAFVLLFVIGGPGVARASAIVPAFSSDGQECWKTGVEPFEVFTTYIVLILEADAAAAGTTACRFRLIGIDPTWFNTVTPNPAANVTLGSPIGTGCFISFPCQTSSSFLLYTIQSLSLTPIPGRVLQIDQDLNADHPHDFCPVVRLCDAPVFTPFCVTGGQAFLNTDSCGCCVAAEPAAWSRVKALFR